MLRERTLIQRDGIQPFGLIATESAAAEAHADPGVERAEPDGGDLVAAFGEDGVEILDAGVGLDLDHDGGLFIDVLVEGEGWVERCV